MPRSRSSRRCFGRREVQAVRRVLALPPAGADSHERPAAGQHVEGGGGLGGDARRPERHRRDQRARARGRCRARRPRPSVTHGSGIEVQARSTCGIWMRWSITDSPAKPASSAARATPLSQASGILAPREPAHLEHHLEPLRRAPLLPDQGRLRRRRLARPARPRGHVCTTSQPSSSSCGTSARCRLSWAASVGAGTGRSRAELRRRHSPSGVSITTTTAGSPTSRARASQRRRRSSSVPRVSTTVVRPATGAGGHHALEQVEGVAGGVEVVRPAADHAAERVGGDDLVAAVAVVRPRGLSRAGRADQDDERRVGKCHPPTMAEPGRTRWCWRAEVAASPRGRLFGLAGRAGFAAGRGGPMLRATAAGDGVLLAGAGTGSGSATSLSASVWTCRFDGVNVAGPCRSGRRRTFDTTCR